MFEELLDACAPQDERQKPTDHLKDKSKPPKPKKKMENGAEEEVSDEAECPSEITEEAIRAAREAFDPAVCLFDNERMASVENNILYMYKLFGFSVPFTDYCIDLPGLLFFLWGKMKFDNQCLYCNRVFRSHIALMDHMREKRHTRVGTHLEENLQDLSPFYDHRKATADLRVSLKPRLDDDEEEISDGWEDVEDDENGGAGSRSQVTEFGWLKLSENREVPPRCLAYIFRQRLSTRPAKEKTQIALEGRRPDNQTLGIWHPNPRVAHYRESWAKRRTNEARRYARIRRARGELAVSLRASKLQNRNPKNREHYNNNNN